jgi:hypothetical protein
VAVSVIGGGNQSTRRKPLTCCIEYSLPYRNMIIIKFQEMDSMRLRFSIFFHRVLFTKINFQSNVFFTIVFSVLKYQSQRVKRHHSEGFKYPIDLWIALSRHIKPEQYSFGSIFIAGKFHEFLFQKGNM